MATAKEIKMGLFVNAETGETIERELTADEIAALSADKPELPE